jgi:peptidoglycan-associated lipoprotein
LSRKYLIDSGELDRKGEYMSPKKKKFAVYVVSILLLVVATGCKKKVSVAAPPAPPETPAAEVAKPTPPTITEFTVQPGLVERGQSAELHWQVKDATQIEINQGIGRIPLSGQRQIGPNDSTTYTLTARGPGGEATANATLSVTLPPAPPAAPVEVKPTIGERLSKEVEDAFFDFDGSGLREDARTALTADAGALQSILSDFPAATVVIEGHCDERGSAEYNLGLGDSRASAAKDFLSQLGVSGDRLIAVSYGKARPQCTESNEACWQMNRRVHFVPGEELKTSTVNPPDDVSHGQSPNPME